MDQNEQFNLVKQIKNLAETGLVYSENEYDTERYEELKEISLKLMSHLSALPLQVLSDFYLPKEDYPTPKIDLRGFALNENRQILMVRESSDGKWSIPGGWGDIGFSPSEVVIKEMKEETGLDCEVIRPLAIYDKKCHPHPPEPNYTYKMVFLCALKSAKINKGFDVLDVGFFDIDQLPDLSQNRILKTQIEQLYQKAIHQDTQMHFD